VLQLFIHVINRARRWKFDNKTRRLSKKKLMSNGAIIRYNNKNRSKKFAGPDEHYGDTDEIEISEEDYAISKESILQILEENKTNRELIFARTLGQSSNPEWFHIRNGLLTAFRADL
jgi:hypothetical protein